MVKERVVLHRERVALMRSGPGVDSTLRFLDGTQQRVSLEALVGNLGAFPENAGRDDLFDRRTHCPVCQREVKSEQKVFEVTQLFWDLAVLTCPECGLLFKDATPKPALLDWLYSSRYVHFQASSCLEQDLSPLFGRVRRLGQGPGKVLDIGCGAGSFVAACLTVGWEAFGIDPYLPEADPRIASRLERASALEFAGHHRGEFERVTLWAAWEHLLVPMPTLTAAFEMVKPGGFLLLNSPRGDSFHAKLRGPSWSMVTLLEHLTFLTRQSAAALATQLGAKSMSVRYCGVPFPMGTGQMSDPQGLEPRRPFVGGITSRPSPRSRVIRFSRENPLVAGLMNRVRLGDHIEIYLHKG